MCGPCMFYVDLESDGQNNFRVGNSLTQKRVRVGYLESNNLFTPWRVIHNANGLGIFNRHDTIL